MACKDDIGYVTHKNSKKLNSKSYYLSAHWLYGNVLLSNITFLIFAVLVV